MPAICCRTMGGDAGVPVAEALKAVGWRHVEREAGVGFIASPHHLWWLPTKDHALGVIVIDDVAGAPLIIWKVRRKSDGLEVEGMGNGVVAAANRAVETLEQWLVNDARHASPKREPKWLPASGIYTSPF